VNASTGVKIGSSSDSADLYVAGNSAGEVSALGSQSSSVTLDLDTANNFSFTIAGTITLNNPSNVVAGQSGAIIITQDGTGSRALSFGSVWKFVDGAAPSIATAAGAKSVLLYFTNSSSEIFVSALIGVS